MISVPHHSFSIGRNFRGATGYLLHLFIITTVAV